MCSINHEKKAIFIHIPKTAGIYIRDTLCEYYDFNTYLFTRDDHVNFCETDLKVNKNKYLYFANKIHGVIQYYKTSKYLNSLMNMNEEKWDTYFKFCFVRDPYERVISAWNYLNETNNKELSFEEYFKVEDKLLSEDDFFHMKMPQYNNTIDENNIFFINYIGKFENLQDDFKEILLKIGFKENEIKHDYEGKNTRYHKKFEDLNINNELLDYINNIFDIDFKMFKYKKIIKNN